MKAFKSNVHIISNDARRAWLDRLPKLVERVSLELGLHDLKPWPNLTYPYVFSGFQGDIPIILKCGSNSESLKREAFALQCFSTAGAVNVIAEAEGWLLLERVVPGYSLKTYFPGRDNEAVEIICTIMKKLHHVEIPLGHHFPHVKDWLSILDKDWALPSEAMQKARVLRDQLLATAGPDVLLHGDLHHDNILYHGQAVRPRTRRALARSNNEKSRRSDNADGWLVIDPKGVIGEAMYEVAAFIRNPIPDLLKQTNATRIIQDRIAACALAFDVSPTRIANWCFVQGVLSWIWALEDSCDTEYGEQMIKILNALLLNG